MPAGPTASEAAEIILLLVDVPFLRSSLCVRFCCPVPLAVLSPARCAHWTKSTPANLDTQGKGRLRLLCDRDTRGTAKSSFPRYRTLDLPAYHSALLDSLLRTCAIATERSQLPSELTSGVLLRRWVTSTHKSRPHKARTRHGQVECNTAVGLTQRAVLEETGNLSLHVRIDLDRTIHLFSSLAMIAPIERRRRRSHTLSQKYWLSFGVQRELTFVTKDEKEKPHAKAWKHDVAIAGLQYDLRVLSSVSRRKNH